jgi:hypothetical protein
MPTPTIPTLRQADDVCDNANDILLQPADKQDLMARTGLSSTQLARETYGQEEYLTDHVPLQDNWFCNARRRVLKLERLERVNPAAQ